MRRRCISKAGPDRLLRYSRDSTLPPSFQQHGRRWHPGTNPDCPIPDSTARQHWSLNLSLYTLLPECSASSGTRDERTVGCWEWRGHLRGPLEGVLQKMQAMLWLQTHLRLGIVWDLELYALSAMVGTSVLLMAQEEQSECLYSSLSSSC